MLYQVATQRPHWPLTTSGIMSTTMCPTRGFITCATVIGLSITFIASIVETTAVLMMASLSSMASANMMMLGHWMHVVMMMVMFMVIWRQGAGRGLSGEHFSILPGLTPAGMAVSVRIGQTRLLLLMKAKVTSYAATMLVLLWQKQGSEII